MASRRVLVVCDDESALSATLRPLAAAHFRVVATRNVAKARSRLRGRRPAALIIDATLPDDAGLELCRQLVLRDRRQAPRIVLLTRPGSVASRVAALEAGADDAVTKPFSSRELVLRVEALLRHAPPHPVHDEVATISIGRVAVDRVEHRVLVDGQPVALTPREVSLLTQLASPAGAVRSRRVLLEGSWRDTRGVVLRLRRKLGAVGLRIENVRGVGYRLRDDRF